MSDEDKTWVDKLSSKEGNIYKIYAFARTLARKNTEGISSIEKHNAEDTLEDKNAIIEAKIAAQYKLDHPEAAFNANEISDIARTIKDEKFDKVDEKSSWNDKTRELKKLYDRFKPKEETGEPVVEQPKAEEEEVNEPGPSKRTRRADRPTKFLKGKKGNVFNR